MGASASYATVAPDPARSRSRSGPGRTEPQAGARRRGGRGGPGRRPAPVARQPGSLPMFPSMETFLRRAPSELGAGDEQTLLGGVAIPGVRGAKGGKSADRTSAQYRRRDARRRGRV